MQINASFAAVVHHSSKFFVFNLHEVVEFVFFIQRQSALLFNIRKYVQRLSLVNVWTNES